MKTLFVDNLKNILPAFLKGLKFLPQTIQLLILHLTFKAIKKVPPFHHLAIATAHALKLFVIQMLLHCPLTLKSVLIPDKTKLKQGSVLITHLMSLFTLYANLL